MRTNLKFLTYALFTLLFATQFTSCSKDSDLLLDYVINEELDALSRLVINDNFIVAAGETALLDVLNNDQFENLENVSIVGTSEPQNGTVSINEDNTLTYTPNTNTSEPEEEVSDTFVYTVEETTENGETNSGDGTVVINSGTTDIGFVNFSEFGAKGDGITDDTDAIQLALESENSLIANENSVFIISKSLQINQNFRHTIRWNGAIIKSSQALNPLITIRKDGNSGNITEMSNLTVDGNKKSMRGIQIESRVSFTNVDITELVQYNSLSPAGFFIKVYDNPNSYGDWTFDGCDVTNIVASSNGTVAVDTWGSANGFLFYWTEVPSQTTTIIYKNGLIENIWGEDAGGFFPNDPTKKIGETDSKIIVENSIFRNAERRQLKGFCSNMFFNNVTFADPSPDNPNIQKATISGMAVFGADNRKNIHFNECKFIGSGYDGRVIPIAVKDFSIKNSKFSGGARLAFTRDIGSGRIENTEFETGSTIFEYGAKFLIQLEIDSNNKADTNYIKLNDGDYILF